MKVVKQKFFNPNNCDLSNLDYTFLNNNNDLLMPSIFGLVCSFYIVCHYNVGFHLRIDQRE